MAGVVSGACTAGLLLASLSAQPNGSFPYGDRVGPGEPVFLSLTAMASLPSDVVFLGGSLRTSAVPLHSVLLVSRNAGETWVEADVRLDELELGAFQTAGTDVVWALARYSKEGLEDPARLLRSRDAGRTWEHLPIDVAHLPGLVSVDDFRFFDAMRGLRDAGAGVARHERLDEQQRGSRCEAILGPEAELFGACAPPLGGITVEDDRFVRPDRVGDTEIAVDGDDVVVGRRVRVSLLERSCQPGQRRSSPRRYPRQYGLIAA